MYVVFLGKTHADTYQMCRQLCALLCLILIWPPWALFYVNEAGMVLIGEKQDCVNRDREQTTIKTIIISVVGRGQSICNPMNINDAIFYEQLTRNMFSLKIFTGYRKPLVIRNFPFAISGTYIKMMGIIWLASVALCYYVYLHGGQHMATATQQFHFSSNYYYLQRSSGQNY